MNIPSQAARSKAGLRILPILLAVLAICSCGMIACKPTQHPGRTRPTPALQMPSNDPMAPGEGPRVIGEPCPTVDRIEYFKDGGRLMCLLQHDDQGPSWYWVGSWK